MLEENRFNRHLDNIGNILLCIILFHNLFYKEITCKMNCIIDLFLMFLSKYSNLVVKYQGARGKVEIENFVKGGRTAGVEDFDEVVVIKFESDTFSNVVVSHRLSLY